MGNMSYCRFNNTVEDLEDCIDAIDNAVGEEEHKRRIRLVRLCAWVIFDYAAAENENEAVDWAESLDVEA